MEPYRQIVESLRQAFPKPVSDRVHDAYFVFSFLRALDQVDAMKSRAPLLGKPEELDYAAARKLRLADEPRTLEEVSHALVEHLSGMFIWGHPRAQINVVPPPTIPSIIGGLLPSIYNPNLCSDESSRKVALAEVEAIAMTAGLVGYDPERVGGLFTFGGTGTILYGAKIGLEKACPGSGRGGCRERVAIVCSDRAHYACRTVANWLGLGEDNVELIPSNLQNEMRICLFETQLRELLKQGVKIAAIVATMGTTDAFGLDDLEAIHEIRDRLAEEFSLDYRPHIHADAVIGWAWSVFDDYDYDANPLDFRHRTVRAIAAVTRRIRHLGLSDSLGIDYHKTGFAPYISSAFLSRDAADLQLIARPRSSTPYLFHAGEYHPAQYSLETSRPGSGPMAALANLLLFGKTGLQSLIGHLVTMCEELREHLKGHTATTVLNDGNYGLVTLFRVYPDGVDTFTVPERERTDPRYREKLLAHNEYNRRIFEHIHAEALKGQGVVISLTDCYRESDYGEPIVALKSYVMSPFSEEEYVEAVLESIWRARKSVGAKVTSDE
ncbi:MAG: pyridoxal-dependent decarboxylase [Planctomycetaceae bacterium]